ncbi:hypothetical protein Fmac_002356 [Flemingia macrophylla]|uniref:Uncharacterized protein n=1 Tax=Flemingia macrophylla TaxID=520843 RepID=A0ABD1NJP6_9FABA
MSCPIEDNELKFPIWHPRDRSHHMPIIASSYNVSTSTLLVLMEQFQCGNQICGGANIVTVTTAAMRILRRLMNHRIVGR